MEKKNVWSENAVVNQIMTCFWGGDNPEPWGYSQEDIEDDIDGIKDEIDLIKKWVTDNNVN